MAKQVMIVAPGSLNPKDKEKLAKAGYVVIEHVSPQDVRIVTMVEEAEMGLVLKSLAEGVKKGNNSFTRECVGLAVVENLLANIIHKAE